MRPFGLGPLAFVISAVVVSCAAAQAQPMVLSTTVGFARPEVVTERVGEYDVVRMQDAVATLEVGFPELPLRIVTLALPEGMVLDPRPMIRGVVEDLERGVGVGEIAGKFHEGFANLLVEAAARAAEATGLRTVALSGGTFQNRILLERVCELVEAGGLRVLHHRAVPPNDGGIALGQAVVAEARMG